MRRPARAQKRALLIAARVQDLSEVQPAHVAGPGRNGGELHEGDEHLRRVAADGRLRLLPSPPWRLHKPVLIGSHGMILLRKRAAPSQTVHSARVFVFMADWLVGWLSGWLYGWLAGHF